MKKSFRFLWPALILILLLMSCNKNSLETPTITLEPEVKAQQKTASILKMSDLEIIKKSADYLKACGKSLVFEETNISFENNLEQTIVCKDNDDEDVYYKGSYLAVHFYPHHQIQEQGNILVVYIGEGGGVLGYSEEQKSQG